MSLSFAVSSPFLSLSSLPSPPPLVLPSLSPAVGSLSEEGKDPSPATPLSLEALPYCTPLLSRFRHASKEAISGGT